MAYSTSVTRSFTGKGPSYIRPRSGGKRAEVGNSSAFDFTITEETQELKDYTAAGGGVKDSISRITSIVGKLSIHDYSPTVLALSLRGASRDVAAGAVVDEEHTVYDEDFVKFNDIPDPDVDPSVVVDVTATWTASTAYELGDMIEGDSRLFIVTVAGTSDTPTEPTWPTDGSTVVDGTVTWQDLGPLTLVKDTHFTFERGGVKILAAGTQGTTYGTPMKIGYTKNPMTIIEAVLNSGIEYEFYWDGLNEVDGDNPVPVTVHRAKFRPTAGLSFIQSDEGFAVTDIEFDVLLDSSIVGAGLSKYMNIGLAP